jgi:hypothetical protein
MLANPSYASQAYIPVLWMDGSDVDRPAAVDQHIDIAERILYLLDHRAQQFRQ